MLEWFCSVVPLHVRFYWAHLFLTDIYLTREISLSKSDDSIFMKTELVCQKAIFRTSNVGPSKIKLLRWRFDCTRCPLGRKAIEDFVKKGAFVLSSVVLFHEILLL